MENNPLEQLMNPKSTAIVGTGNSPMKMVAIQVLSIVKDGFPGKFYPVHAEKNYSDIKRTLHRLNCQICRIFPCLLCRCWFQR